MQAAGVVGDHEHVHDEAEQTEEHQTHCEDNVSNPIQSKAEGLSLQSLVGNLGLMSGLMPNAWMTCVSV